MKTTRQSAILDIIANEDIETQSQMLEALAKRGCASTQATVSRDIKELHLVKSSNPDGHSYYTQASEEELNGTISRLEEIFREACISVEHALHTVVIRTMPGLASAVCAAIDNMDDDCILGTVAGDDTALIILRNTSSAERLCNQFRRAYIQ